MENATIKNAAASAAKKVATGALLTISETSAMLSVAPATVHALPLPSIRLGKLLRFDPADVPGYQSRFVPKFAPHGVCRVRTRHSIKRRK